MSIPTEELSRVDLVTPELWEERVLHDEFALLRREDPVHWHEERAPSHGFWAITKHEDVVAVSKNPQVFSSGEGLTMLEEVEPESLEKRRSLIDSDAPLHQHLRRVVSPLFLGKGGRRAETGEEGEQQGARGELDHERLREAGLFPTASSWTIGQRFGSRQTCVSEDSASPGRAPARVPEQEPEPERVLEPERAPEER